MGTFTEAKNNLEQTNERGLFLPPQMSTQGFLQKKIEVQSQGTYFLLRFSNRKKKWSFCNKLGSKACSINKRFTNPILKQISQVTQ